MSPVQPTVDAAAKKRKRTRKVYTDKKFVCSHESCGKSYSRAEHLYRHQLNHTPKQIYRCDFPDCYRSFVRQDLCIRHRERHTTRGSQLQKRDHFAQAASHHGKPLVPSNVPSTTPPTTLPSSSILPATSNPQTPSTVPLGTYHYMPDYPFSRPQSSTNYTLASPAAQSTASFPPYGPVSDRSSSHTPISDLGQDPQQFETPVSTTTTSQAIPTSYQPFSAPDMNATSFNPTTTYDSQPGMTIPVTYSDLSLATATAPTPTTLSGLESSVMAPGPTVSDAGFDPMSPCAYPMFGGETYNRSPFAMGDDFAAWLFNEPGQMATPPPSTTSPSLGGFAPLPPPVAPTPATTGMMPGYLDTMQMSNSFLVNDPGCQGFLVNNMLPTQQHPMSVTSILDTGPPQGILSGEKRQDLLQLMSIRFNEAAYSAAAKRKDSLMDGNLDDDQHVLSPRMMQTYIGSYWYHFHPQLPILHQPTFATDETPNLLLLAIIAIGAATMDKVHGSVTEASAQLADFISWHLRWELFMDADFRPPAKLWIFQALLLLEVYEKRFSTRALHERAHIHHDTTLTLMRRGSSLIGKDACGNMHEGGHSRSGSTSTVADESWSNWIKAEGTRRVAFAAFVLDSTHATMFGHSVKMVAHELRLPLPCDEALWSANSSAEVARMQSSLKANGVRPVLFLDGLKKTLNGESVRTNAFGRAILMSGLLSVSWHMNQRDLQVSSLGVPHALGGRDKWRSSLVRAFDNWRRDYDESLGQGSLFSYNAHRLGAEDPVLDSRDALHALAHMASHVDIVDCQIFAGAGRLLGRSITARDHSAAGEKMTSWAAKASARDATFYALKILSKCLLPEQTSTFWSNEVTSTYSARDDYLLNRPWVLYMAALVVWSYGYALDGPLGPVSLSTKAEQAADMHSFLRRIGGARDPNELQHMGGRNQCLGLLMILRDSFVDSRWELIQEAGELVGCCVGKLSSV
ncbi:putative C2H2 finger domain protein [Aspergillus ruber CBS 135680]|uniref:C2H2-type domain-containing protein n=1 Tax=Aspergillus ruber (strain CBS 135680) TaxID=1388766 RepID=A0A017SR19_ASPRC|nr:uncharacterized protein EURHEDRAFT_512897 [Aspergillus ruber CBS 135680]EYE98720.1 hypothetical protein EURHEDRAFT_512897 [Aspergillus ruber CBS 135680]